MGGYRKGEEHEQFPKCVSKDIFIFHTPRGPLPHLHIGQTHLEKFRFSDNSCVCSQARTFQTYPFKLLFYFLHGKKDY